MFTQKLPSPEGRLHCYSGFLNRNHIFMKTIHRTGLKCPANQGPGLRALLCLRLQGNARSLHARSPS